MRFWNYVCEFLLFRWLFGGRGTDRDVESSQSTGITDYTPRHVDTEDYIDLDDDFGVMNQHGCGYQSDRSYGNYGYSSSWDDTVDDFLDEQDDFDMIDDDF